MYKLTPWTGHEDMRTEPKAHQRTTCVKHTDRYIAPLAAAAACSRAQARTREHNILGVSVSE